MHIAYITPEYPIDQFKGNIGGIGTFTKNIAEQLVLSNVKVTVFVHSQTIEKIFSENGVIIHFVKLKKVKGLTWYTNRIHFKRYVNKVIREQKIDVIEAPEWSGFTAFIKFKCPLVLRLHGSDTFFCNLENRKVKFKNLFFEKKALFNADKIIGVSDFVSKKTKELFGLTSEIQTIYNKVNVDKTFPNHTNIKPKSLLYFGTIIRKKGVLELAKMFNELVILDENVTLNLLGKDSLDVLTGKSTLKLFKELLSEKALQQIKHINAVPPDEVITFLQNSEIIVLPSFAEAFPMTWLEAMVMEKKILTSNIGWANELMIDGETGYTVDPLDTIGFTNKVMSLLEDKKKSLRMAKNSRNRIINNFDIKQSVEENIKLYKSML